MFKPTTTVAKFEASEMQTVPASEDFGTPGRAIAPWPAVVLWIGVALIAVPTMVANFRQSWTTEQSQQTPLVLAIALWLIIKRWPSMRAAAQPSSAALAGLVGAVVAVIYVFGRVADQFEIESYALYALGLMSLYALLGWRSLKTNWFPLAYLALALPAPYTVTWFLTSHLRLWVTEAAVSTFQLFGFSVVRDGLNILIDQYELAVLDACSGMNSLISLSALGLVYIYLRRSPPFLYYAIMVGPIVFFAIFGNFVRIIVLIGLTHYCGDAVAQGYLHEGAGVVTFVAALAGIIAADATAAMLLSPARKRGGFETKRA